MPVSPGAHHLLRTRPALPAFTLVELLVVVGTIALLVMLLMTGLANARGSAGRTACQTTLAQWGRAVGMYTDANKGYLPRRGQGAQPTSIVDRPEDWFNALPPLMNAPAYRDLVKAGRVPRPGESGIHVCRQATKPPGEHFFSYAMNMRLSTWNTEKPDRIDRVAQPSVQVFMADGPGNYCSALPSRQAYSPVARHLDRVNISFLDGHVHSFAGDYVGCGLGDPHRGNIQWVVPGSPWPGPVE